MWILGRLAGTNKRGASTGDIVRRQKRTEKEKKEKAQSMRLVYVWGLVVVVRRTRLSLTRNKLMGYRDSGAGEIQSSAYMDVVW